MARDRQRAKQRKARRAGQNPGPTPSEPHRANVPGELEHASGQVDEFDAALVAGAGGVADDEPSSAHDDELAADDPTAAREPDEEAFDDEPFDEPDADEFGADADAAASPGRRAEVAASQRAGAPARGGPGRFLAFLRASWAELQRVSWPDRRQVAQATAVVLGFVVIAGLYLGIADRVAQEVVDFII
jgi:preprotein translocase subunit SecE